MNNIDHQPVLLQEVLKYLKIQRGQNYIDATVGLGGHAREILRQGGNLLGIDRDLDSIEILRKKWALEKIKSGINAGNWTLEKGNFKDLEAIAKKHNFTKVAGILFDFGLSSWQIDKSRRGFSYQHDEPLDMRFDKKDQIVAADILNSLPRENLYEIFTKFAEEQFAGRIADAIVRARPLKRTGELRMIIEKAVPGKTQQKIKSVARIFQAVRIKVNNEIESIKLALPQSLDLLDCQGRLLVISFHSLEDRIIKQFFQEAQREGKARIIIKKPIEASLEEMKINKRAKAAKLRVLEKI